MKHKGGMIFILPEICEIDSSSLTYNNCVATALFHLGILNLKEFNDYSEITKSDSILTSPLGIKNKVIKHLKILYDTNKIIFDNFDKHSIDSIDYISIKSIESLKAFIKRSVKTNEALYISLALSKSNNSYHSIVIYKNTQDSIIIYDNDISYGHNGETYKLSTLEKSDFLKFNLSKSKILLGLLNDEKDIDLIERNDIFIIRKKM